MSTRPKKGRLYFPLDESYVPAPVCLFAQWTYGATSGELTGNSYLADGLTPRQAMSNTMPGKVWATAQAVDLDDPYMEIVGASATISNDTSFYYKTLFKWDDDPAAPFPRKNRVLYLLYFNQPSGVTPTDDTIVPPEGTTVLLRVWVKNSTVTR